MSYKSDGADGGLVTLIVVDDDLGEAKAVRRSFAKAGVGNPIVHVMDGVEAIEFLHSKEAPEKYVMLVDLNMPRMNGIELVREIRADPRLNKSVVFMLTTSDDQRDIAAAYELNVAGYMVKFRVGEDFKNLIDTLGCYWNLVEFPVIPQRQVV